MVMNKMQDLNWKAPMRERRYQRWVAIALGCVLLLFAQAMAPAKTLLEQYLNCDGFEEFVFYVEYPDYPDIVPTTYYSGAYQDENFFIVRSGVPLSAIPSTPPLDQSTTVYSHYDRNWVVLSVGESGYDNRVWEDNDIAAEEDNPVKAQCELGVGFLDGIFNFALNGAKTEMTRDKGMYLQVIKIQVNEMFNVSVDYEVIDKNKDGMPTTILAHSLREGMKAAVTWKIVAEYNDNSTLNRITLFSNRLEPDGSASADFKRVFRVIVDKLVPAKEKLPRSYFLRPSYDVSGTFTQEGYPTTYHYKNGRFIGLDSKSNEVVRIEPGDPRILELPDSNRLIAGYWISAALITVLATVFFVWTRRKGSEDVVTNDNKK